MTGSMEAREPMNFMEGAATIGCMENPGLTISKVVQEMTRLMAEAVRIGWLEWPLRRLRLALVR